MTGNARNLGFLGGIGLTHLKVYEQRPAPDGTMSGCAHVHALTDEAYYVIAGAGAIELHDLEHGFRIVPLTKGSFVQFPPGTLHRSVSTDGLEVLAIMGNSGLAERGDARIYFGRAVDEDAVEFARLCALPAVRGIDGALERRDASCRAYLRLLDLWRDDRAAYRAELERFIDLHRRAVAERRSEYESVIRGGPEQWLRLSLARLDTAPVAAAPGSGVSSQDESSVKLGMCGTLRQLETLSPI
jgi:mannose-6-phosphate isomerase-like protein (cupin superfamily)